MPIYGIVVLNLVAAFSDTDEHRSILRDRTIYEDPEEFRPERFSEAVGDEQMRKIRDPRTYIFGFGRRYDSVRAFHRTVYGYGRNWRTLIRLRTVHLRPYFETRGPSYGTVRYRIR